MCSDHSARGTQVRDSCSGRATPPRAACRLSLGRDARSDRLMNLLASLAAELQRLSEPDPARPPRPARCPRCYSADAGSRGRGTRHPRVVGAQSPMSNGEVQNQAFAVELGRDGSAMHKLVFRDGVGGLLSLSESEGGVRGPVCLCLAAEVDASPTPHTSFAPPRIVSQSVSPAFAFPSHISRLHLWEHSGQP